MLQTVFIWLRQYGGLALVIGGMVVYLTTLALEVVQGLRFPYPWSLQWTAIMILPPAIGVALLYLQSRDEADEDGHVAQQGPRRGASRRAGQEEREME